MEIPGIGEKMVDKIYQAVNRFYEGGEQRRQRRRKVAAKADGRRSCRKRPRSRPTEENRSQRPEAETVGTGERPRKQQQSERTHRGGSLCGG